jgi:hypothetical protein
VLHTIAHFPIAIDVGTMTAAVKFFVYFDAVSNDFHTAVSASRSKVMLGTLKAIEHIRVSVGYYDERFVITISARITNAHVFSPIGPTYALSLPGA